LYLVSLTPRIPAGIKPENTGIDPEQIAILRRESVRSGLAMLQGPKAGGDEVLDVAGAGSWVIRKNHDPILIRKSLIDFKCGNCQANPASGYRNTHSMKIDLRFVRNDF
jgi:hypothetical protein